MQTKLTLIFLFVASLSLAQQPLNKAPKEYSAEVGYRYLSANPFDNTAEAGYTFLLDYAWLLSGFNGGRKVYLTVPLAYTAVPPTHELFDNMGILSYGWTVRHELSKNKKNVPFMGYALLLNQLRIQHIEGSVFGHQTRFAGGYNFNRNRKISYFTKVEYSFTRYPALYQAKSKNMHAWEIKVGVRFGKQPE